MTIKDLITRRDRTPAAIGRRDEVFSEFNHQMNRLFDDFFRDFNLVPSWETSMQPLEAFSPRLNISENEKELNISAELPGLERKDISIELEDNTLTISGERREEHEEKNRRWHRVEQSYGAFHRSVPLPSGVDAGAAKAEFKNGILKVTLPKLKKELDSRKTIDIKSA